jgi:hypothetical protein
MKIAFITELPLHGKVPDNYFNMRTEFAWMHTLNADHFNITKFQEIKDYDHVFIIFPKGEVYLNSVGSTLINKQNPISPLLRIDLIGKLKQSNKKVHFIQEGPHWLWNDYEIPDQIYYYNMISSCDSIFCHNKSDVNYYKGLFPNIPINPIQTLMIDRLISNLVPIKEYKTIIGGNFARWYGGFESYIVSNNFNTEIWAQESHAKRVGEEVVDGIKHLPRLFWIDWMKALSSFKYAVHLMPTVAAGTFSLNCAYFGIPCIGNAEVDTQNICHPDLSVDVSDINYARQLAIALRDNKNFYNKCSKEAKENYHKYYSLDTWKDNMNKILSSL